jgi:hypothetical protein
MQNEAYRIEEVKVRSVQEGAQMSRQDRSAFSFDDTPDKPRPYLVEGDSLGARRLPPYVVLAHPGAHPSG